VLLLDGVEKAERNVLPILNNLLENREMQLEDGRFLMAAERYDKLLQQGHTPEQLKEWRLERVSEDFSVVALGLAVPPFTGHTLDPPLRSRFQCRNIGPLPYGTMVQMCSALAPNVDTGRVNELLALVYGLNSQQHKSGMAMEASVSAYKRTDEPDHLSVVDTMPLLPVDSLLKAVRVWVGCWVVFGSSKIEMIDGYPISGCQPFPHTITDLPSLLPSGHHPQGQSEAYTAGLLQALLN